MARERYSNAVTTTLDGSINDSVTTLDLDDASSWPPSSFRVIIGTEIMFCTSRSTNTLTVIRGYEGTVAASHADGDPALHVLTAGAIDAIRRDILCAAGMISHEASLSSDDDDFDDESFSGWTTVEGTPTVTVTEMNHRASILIPSGTASAQHAAFMKAKTVSPGDWIQCGIQMGGNGGQFPGPGLIMADGATYGSGKQAMFVFSINENQHILRRMTGFNNQVGSNNGSTVNAYFWPTLHLRMTYTALNQYTTQTSPDGITWANVHTTTSIGDMASAPTYVGFVASTWGSSNAFVESFTYFRCNF
jgi:hypothetical protein